MEASSHSSSALLENKSPYLRPALAQTIRIVLRSNPQRRLHPFVPCRALRIRRPPAFSRIRESWRLRFLASEPPARQSSGTPSHQSLHTKSQLSFSSSGSSVTSWPFLSTIL